MEWIFWTKYVTNNAKFPDFFTLRDVKAGRPSSHTGKAIKKRGEYGTPYVHAVHTYFFIEFSPSFIFCTND